MANPRPGIPVSFYDSLDLDSPPTFPFQPPPPSLREILGAYRTRGNGDREMLTAMLNAKSAEDQVLTFLACHCHRLTMWPSTEDSVCRLSSSFHA
jgi:hypothetical protein